jgi:uncharacterized protein YjbI with pentapeptide repeats
VVPQKVKLTDADLINARLPEADLTGADLTEAKLAGRSSTTHDDTLIRS